MSYTADFLLLVLVFIFLALTLGLYSAYRRRLRQDFYRGTDLDLARLSALRSRLTEEEYERLRKVLVEKMAGDLEMQKTLKKEVRLADLESELQKIPKTPLQEEQPKSSREHPA